jgi:cell pole-organizing protein PopZ
MEEILASIRRILTEEENERAASQEEQDDDILVLGSAMKAPAEDGQAAAVAQPEPAWPDSQLDDAPQLNNAVPQFESPERMETTATEAQAGAAPWPDLEPYPFTEAEPPKKENEMEDQVQSPEGLVSAAAANEIANTVGSLVRSVSAERSVTVGRPGVTIEDLVREEIKPVLKSWLDTHLPSLVERVVRAEIGRVVDRMQS